MNDSGKQVLVTGAAQGIGKAIADAYEAKGCLVYRIDRNKIENGTSYLCDVSDAEAVYKLFETLDGQGAAIDILVNNVGISRNGDFLKLALEDFDLVYRTNLRSVMLLSQLAARRMAARGSSGAIVNLASTRAFMSEPDTEAYSASKGGIIALTHSLALSLGRYGIRVNSISPGWIHNGDASLLTEEDHSQHPCGRVGRPEDIARACLYLTDPDNGFVTGENLVVDGGMSRKMIYVE